MIGTIFDNAATDSDKLQKNSARLAEALKGAPGKIDAGRALEIIREGIDPAARFDDNNTLLIMAAYVAEPDIVIALLDSGVDPNAANKRLETPLHYAAKALSAPAVQALLAHGADIYARTEFGDTAEQCVMKGDAPDTFCAAEKLIMLQATGKAIHDGIQARIKSDMETALFREEIQNFTGTGCATKAEVKPMKTLRIKMPGSDT